MVMDCLISTYPMVLDYLIKTHGYTPYKWITSNTRVTKA